MPTSSELWDRVKGNLVEFRTNCKKQWDLLTDDEIRDLHGNRDLLIQKIQERYDLSKQDANRQIDQWIQTCYGAPSR